MKILMDPLAYFPDMEQISSDMLEQVLQLRQDYCPENYTRREAEQALNGKLRGSELLAALLSPAAQELLEEMAGQAWKERRRYFGNAVQMFTPLYIANYCENHCVYCGFNCRNQIRRGKLSLDEIHRELASIAATGLREVLLLTGEARQASGVEFIARAVQAAAEYFPMVGVEIYPLATEEYAYLHEVGADLVCVYQETYDPVRYGQVHLSGSKRSFPYRFYAQERALRGGMRSVAFGSLLGLGDFRRDAFATGMHAYLIQQKYPQAEISFSVPRLRPYIHKKDNRPAGVREKELLQVMLAYRLFLPFAGMTISTRERAGFRDQAAKLAANKVSAGVSVGVGGYAVSDKGDEQFEIADDRSVFQMHEQMIHEGLQPVYVDHIRV